MLHEEPTNVVRAVYLLALGGALGLVGLVLHFSRGALHPELADAATTAAKLVLWAPRALVGLGCVLATAGAALVGLDWMQRRG